MRTLALFILLPLATLFAQSLYHWEPNHLFTYWNLTHDVVAQRAFFDLVQQHCMVESWNNSSPNLRCSVWVDSAESGPQK
jgi:hypothetical protein